MKTIIITQDIPFKEVHKSINYLLTQFDYSIKNAVVFFDIVDDENIQNAVDEWEYANSINDFDFYTLMLPKTVTNTNELFNDDILVLNSSDVVNAFGIKSNSTIKTIKNFIRNK